MPRRTRSRRRKLRLDGKRSKSRKGKKKSKKKKKEHVKFVADVFLMVRRKKATIFIDAKEDTTVLELKRMVAGITKVPPEDQKLFANREEMKEEKHLCDYGFTGASAKPQNPATVSLVYRDGGSWEEIDIAPLSQPPELPEVMRLSVDVSDSRANNPEQAA